jgi:myo-inositol-1-phosphate synthase
MTNEPHEKVINCAIAGVGNCASSLVQVACAARALALPPEPAGLVHDHIGPYAVKDIRFVAAFDVDERKIGKDLAEAIGNEPNCTTMYFQPAPLGIIVQAGLLEDGLDGELANVIRPHPQCSVTAISQIAQNLRDIRADVLVCYLPTGSSRAIRSYAYAAADAGVAFIKATTEPVANDKELSEYFCKRGVPLLGDDVKSQLGATALHTALADFCKSRNAAVDRTYQLNVGGNTDFLNMLDPARSASKRLSKASALEASGLDARGAGAGPTGFIPHLQDFKVAYIHIEGRLLLNMPFSMEVRLQVEDSPNSAGVIIDALRVAKCGKDKGSKGVMQEVCPHLFKCATLKLSERDARQAFESALAAV